MFTIRKTGRLFNGSCVLRVVFGMVFFAFFARFFRTVPNRSRPSWVLVLKGLAGEGAFPGAGRLAPKDAKIPPTSPHLSKLLADKGLQVARCLLPFTRRGEAKSINSISGGLVG